MRRDYGMRYVVFSYTSFLQLPLPGLAYFTAACQTQRILRASGLLMLSQLAGLHGVATFLSTT